MHAICDQLWVSIMCSTLVSTRPKGNRHEEVRKTAFGFARPPYMLWNPQISVSVKSGSHRFASDSNFYRYSVLAKMPLLQRWHLKGRKRHHRKKCFELIQFISINSVFGSRRYSAPMLLFIKIFTQCQVIFVRDEVIPQDMKYIEIFHASSPLLRLPAQRSGRCLFYVSLNDPSESWHENIDDLFLLLQGSSKQICPISLKIGNN